MTLAWCLGFIAGLVIGVPAGAYAVAVSRRRARRALWWNDLPVAKRTAAAATSSFDHLWSENLILREGLAHALMLCKCGGNGILNSGCSCSSGARVDRFGSKHECTNVIRFCDVPECVRARSVLKRLFTSLEAGR